MAARLPGLIAATLTAAVALLYVIVILGQDDPRGDEGRVVLFAGATALAALLAAGGSFADDPLWRTLQFGIATAVTLVLAVLGAPSIGVPCLPPLALLVFAVGWS